MESDKIIEGGYAEIVMDARKRGMDEGIWLCIQDLVHMGYGQAATEIMGNTGMKEEECMLLQDNSGSFDDEMRAFISSYFNEDIDLGGDDEDDDEDGDHVALVKGDVYHKMGKVFNLDINGKVKSVKFAPMRNPISPCEGCVLYHNDDPHDICNVIACESGLNSDRYDCILVAGNEKEEC